MIAIGHNKQPLSYALMLAALRLGVAYVNVDVASPTARTVRDPPGERRLPAFLR